MSLAQLASSMPTALGPPPVLPVARRARSPKSTSRQAPAVASKPRKYSFYLSQEAIRRLGIAATMESTDKSALLERVIAESPSLRRYRVADMEKGAGVADSDDRATGDVSTS